LDGNIRRRLVKVLQVYSVLHTCKLPFQYGSCIVTGKV
jgi:hypothetical protein